MGICINFHHVLFKIKSKKIILVKNILFKIISLESNNSRPSFWQRMDSIVEKFCFIWSNLVIKPIFDICKWTELLSCKGWLHLSEQMVIWWRDVWWVKTSQPIVFNVYLSYISTFIYIHLLSPVVIRCKKLFLLCLWCSNSDMFNRFAMALSVNSCSTRFMW